MSDTPEEIVLSEQQANALTSVISLENILITGPAGTGKSVLLRAIRKHFREMYLNVGVCGSTGMAAVNVQGLTIHTWAGLGLAELDAERLAWRIVKGRNRRPFDNITNTNHLLLDEVSMIPASLLEKIDHVFRFVRRVDKPFGGVQMILFGDFLQLPPVSKDHAHPERFAFESPLWKTAAIRTTVLTQVFRQKDPDFAEALAEVRIGQLSDKAREILNQCTKTRFPDDGIEPVILMTHNDDADAVNMSRLAALEAKQYGYDAADEGTEEARKILERCLLPKRLEIKVGAQVMCCYNLDLDRGIVNGTLGVVTAFTGNLRSIPVVRFANGVELIMEPIEWKVYENEKEIGCRTQIPLRLAWAITVHKSQGMTLDRVRCHLGRVFDFGQAYVALSRARTREGLHIASGGRSSIRAHPKALMFYERAASGQ